MHIYFPNSALAVLQFSIMTGEKYECHFFACLFGTLVLLQDMVYTLEFEILNLRKALFSGLNFKELIVAYEKYELITGDKWNINDAKKSVFFFFFFFFLSCCISREKFSYRKTEKNVPP